LGSFSLMATYALFFLLLQVSSNAAQGPFQGYVPDLVAEPQVGLASGVVGVMRVSGLVSGAFIMLAVGRYFGLWGLALVIIGVIELSLALAVPAVRNVPGTSRVEVALDAMEAWGTTCCEGVVPADPPLCPDGNRNLLGVLHIESRGSARRFGAVSGGARLVTAARHCAAAPRGRMLHRTGHNIGRRRHSPRSAS
jgi:hypothetical protein